jgi:hypothetical protein
MEQAQDIGLGYELNVVPELNNRSDGLGAIRPRGRSNIPELDLMETPI